ncbi:MAG: hypothetical protein DHS20C16_27280 [Phycisphaerae bacterium]|nr:MAG: hypothetical protein DHS20C16_27280 [Phycisphaerae bacterium]
MLAVAVLFVLLGCNGPTFEPSPPISLEVIGLGLEGIAAPKHTTVERITDSFQDGSSAIDLYVPIDADRPTPVVIVLQGARVHKSYYSGFCARIAAHGFVVASANHNSPLGYFTSTASVRDVLTYLNTRANDFSDQLFDVIDLERIGIFGHSFGGATALTLVQGDCNFPFCAMAFERPNSLRAVSVYGSHLVELTGDVISVDAKGLPIQLVSGDRDSVADSADIEQTYDAIRNGSKQLVQLKRANHFAINDLNNPPGTVTDSSTPLIEQDISIAVAADWVGLFMRAHVRNEVDAHHYFQTSGTHENDQFTATYEPFQLQPPTQAQSATRMSLSEADLDPR